VIRIPRKTKIVINVMLFCIFGIFSLVMALSVFKPKSIDSFGDSVATAYFSYHKSRVDEAFDDFEEGSLEGITRLLISLEDIQNGDRIYNLKRKLFLKLTVELHEREMFQELYSWCEIWLELNERDVTAMAYFYEAMRHLPGKEDEGLRNLTREISRFPNNESLKNFHRKAALETFGISSAIILDNRWKVYWDEGDGYTEKNSLSNMSLSLFDSLGETYLGLSLILPGNANRIRVDLPPNSKLTISNVELKYDHEMVSIPIAEITTNMMEETKESIRSVGEKDPFFYFNVQKAILKNVDLNKAFVSFKLTEDIGSWIKE
jgi:hypothetical protein